VCDPLAKETYQAVVAKHGMEVAPALQQIDARIKRVATSDDTAELECLRTMRTVLLSGLFDADLYLQKYPDVQEARIDPLEHYVQRGDRQMRIPNAVFFPFYYRREFMSGLPGEQNTLEHYIKVGEAAGARPNSAFDPSAYIGANPGLAEFVDRPLFHYLKIGRAGGDELLETRVARILNPLMEYVYPYLWRHLLPEAKRSLVAGFGVEEGFVHYRALVDQPDQAEIHLKPLVDLQDIAQADALAAYHEIAPAGEHFVLPAPTVIAADPPLPQSVQTRAFFVACLVNARVRAGSTVIETDKLALHDYQGDEMRQFDEHPEDDPSIFATVDDAAWIIAPKDSAASLEIEEAFTLLGFTGNHFGHWIAEYLPKYVAASMSGGLPPVPLLMEANASKSLRQALELVVPEGINIIEMPPLATANIRRLWCAPLPERSPTTDDCPEPKRFAGVVSEMARRIDRAVGPVAGPGKVFLARSPNFPRKLVNREAVEAMAQARGFVVAFPEHLDFSDQYQLTRNASFVIGPDGSAMYLALFAKAGAKVCMLSSRDALVMMPGRAGPFAPLGMALTVFVGMSVRTSVRLGAEFPPDSDYEIDAVAFGRFLDQWLESGAG
jgi:capsular polysaccharide biosynthesis protein